MKPEPNCPECAQPEGRALREEGKILYEDDESLIFVPKTPSLPGHLQVQSKNHENNLGEMTAEEARHLFHLANYAAASLFESLQAQGTNIILTEGLTPHATLNILSRKMDDGVSLQWQPKAITPQEMDEIAQKIKDKIIPDEKKTGPKLEEKKESPKEKIIQIEKQLENVKDKIVDTPEKENYLLKQLEKIP